MNTSTAPAAYVFKTISSPIGTLKLIGSDRGLAAILWEVERPRRVFISATAENRNHPVLVATENQLTEYFAGTRTAFDIRLDFVGTAFQKSVWHELLKIPFGKTRTYGDIAATLGNPLAVRAVGAANGRNPISVITPCHRVIGASGALTGFAGGLNAKAYLLDFERGMLRLDGITLAL